MKQKKTLSRTKEHFEMLIAKKQYENLSKPWYKKLEVWKVLIGSVLTFLSVAVLYHNGLFDFQTKALQAERNALLAQKEYLEYAKAKLSDEQVSMQFASNELIKKQSSLEQQVSQLEFVKQKAFKSLDERDKFLAQVLARNITLETQGHENTEKLRQYESMRFGSSLYSPTANTNIFDYQSKPYDYSSSILSQYANSAKYSGNLTDGSVWEDTSSLLKTIGYSIWQKNQYPYTSPIIGSTNYLTHPVTTQPEVYTLGTSTLGQSNIPADASKWWARDNSTTGSLTERLIISTKH